MPNPNPNPSPSPSRTTLTELVLDGLAAYRLTRLVTEDVVLNPYREALYARLPPHSPHLRDHPLVPNPAYVTTCSTCASVYAAALVVVLPAAVRRAAAASAAAMLLFEHLPRRSGWN